MADEQNQEGNKAPTQEQLEIAAIQRSVDTGSFKLPDNIKTAEDLYNSYKNLQSHSTKVAQENAALKAAQEKKAAEPPVDDLASALETPEGEQTDGIDWPTVEKELQSKGDLSPETRKRLTDAKIPASMIEAQVQAHKQKKAADAQAAADMVGGQDELKRILEWGKSNLSKADAAVVQDQLRGPGWKLALLGLANMARNKEPGDMTTSNGVAAGVLPYATQAEMTKDIRDPRYTNQTDSAFIKQVQARVQATAKAAKVAK